MGHKCLVACLENADLLSQLLQVAVDGRVNGSANPLDRLPLPFFDEEVRFLESLTHIDLLRGDVARRLSSQW